jgi:hypothetical protein
MGDVLDTGGVEALPVEGLEAGGDELLAEAGLRHG